jgi:hypothetical protein
MTYDDWKSTPPDDFPYVDEPANDDDEPTEPAYETRGAPSHWRLIVVLLVAAAVLAFWAIRGAL